MHTPDPNISLSLITFAYNEEDGLERQIAQWTQELDRFVADWEIVLVNDASTDRTRQVADALSAKDPRIRVVHKEQNGGVGRAIGTARAHVSKNWVFWNDIDGHFDLKDLEKVLPYLRDPDVDLLVCFKHDNMGGKSSSFHWFKSRANYYLLRLLFVSGIRDFQFVQFYPRQYFCQGIELEAYSSFVPPECVLKAQALELNIRQIQLRYVSHPARASKTTLQAIIISVFNIFTFWWRWRFGGGRKRTLAHYQNVFGGGKPWRKSSS